jgi:hypothetical protein
MTTPGNMSGTNPFMSSTATVHGRAGAMNTKDISERATKIWIQDPFDERSEICSDGTQ